jgi:hypothetical protein
MAINDEPSIQNMPYKPGEGGAGIKNMPYTPPKNGSGPTFENMPFKPNPNIGPTTPPSARTPGAQVPGFNPRRGPSAPDRGNNPNRISGVIGKVGDYLGNIKRSVQDVPTALGTALDTKGSMAAGTNGMPSGTAPIKNLATQIGQVGSSVLGKKDTSRSSQFYGPNKLYIDTNTDKGFFLNNPAKLKPPKG